MIRLARTTKFLSRHAAAIAAGAALIVAAGCQSTAKRPADAAANVDMESIAEAPTPKIQPQTYVAAGDLASSRGQFAQAAHQYSQALDQLPADGPLVKKLALVQVKAGDMPGAVVSMQRYLVATNHSADAYGSLGYAYELAGQPDEAIRTYEDGIKKHPDGALTHINYGLMLVRRGKVDDAIRQLSAALEPHEVNYDVAGVYEQMGRKDLAQFYYRKSLECNPGFVAARQKLTMVE